MEETLSMSMLWAIVASVRVSLMPFIEAKPRLCETLNGLTQGITQPISFSKFKNGVI